MRLPVFARKSVEPASPGPEDMALRFVVITDDEPFYARLRTLADACQWQIARAKSVNEVEEQFSSAPVPIVVYERDWEGGDWRTGLTKLHQIPAKPCVLLASRVADEYLWQEVVLHHGYDILPKTAPDEKLIRLLKFAWFWARSTGQRPAGAK
jgi:hypothetical protein